MKGGIYSRQHCGVCGGTFADDQRRNELSCPEHPDQRATTFFVKFPGVYKRFDSYRAASRFLNGLRFKSDEGSFDPRDYQKDMPLGFANLGVDYLHHLEKTDMRCIRIPRNHICVKAAEFFGNTNIKEITYADLEDFIESLPAGLSEKTKHNIVGSLKAFWAWLVKRRVVSAAQAPEFPEIHYELGYRKTADKATQQAILNELKAISWQINPKIYIGCLFLSTYVNVRPIELIHVQEKDIDLHYGIMLIRHNKERKPKTVHLLSEDVALLKSFPTPISGEMYFFRHEKRKGVAMKYRRRFGTHYLHDWWERACNGLGVEGVSLYPGTKHSTVIALGETMTPEQIKKFGTGHASNKAFDRYFQVDAAQKRALFAATRPATNPQPKTGGVAVDKALKLI